MQFYTLFKIDWTEYERGWGQRPDGTTLHKNLTDANNYINEFNKRQYDRNSNGSVPDNYTKPDAPEPIPVPKDIYDFVMNSKENRYWISPSSWWNNTKPYVLPAMVDEDIIITHRKEPLMKSVDDLTIEELETLLNKKKEEALSKIPEMRVIHNDEQLSHVRNIVLEIMNAKETDPNYDVCDDKEYLFEAVLEMYYGKNIWEWWINQ